MTICNNPNTGFESALNVADFFRSQKKLRREELLGFMFPIIHSKAVRQSAQIAPHQPQLSDQREDTLVCAVVMLRRVKQ